MKENNTLNMHSEKLQRMMTAKETVQKLHEERGALKEDVAKPGLQDDCSPQVASEAMSAMNDVLNLSRNDDKSAPNLDELVSSLNTDQSRVFELVKSHLEHQLLHKNEICKCTDWKRLQMFVSGVSGTGKSFLIKTIRALVSSMWGSDETVCRHCPYWTGSVQCGWRNHPSAATAPHPA